MPSGTRSTTPGAGLVDGGERVVELLDGDDRGIGGLHRYTWKTRLPYRLTFDMRTVRVRRSAILEGVSPR